MKDFRTVTLADQVFERLESDIIQGVYPRGEVLTELRLVEQLNVSRTPIREALRRLEQEHLIADTGKGTVVLGITAEDLPRIFDRGYTGRNGRTYRQASGIGLYLCRRICRDLGHTITASSAAGEGTVLRLDLSRRTGPLE